MIELKLEIPEGVLASLRRDPEDFKKRAPVGGCRQMVRDETGFPRQGCRDRRSVARGVHRFSGTLRSQPVPVDAEELMREATNG